MDNKELLTMADDRIYNFENWGDWETFVSSFSDEEIEAMRKWMDKPAHWQNGYNRYGRKWDENTIMLYMALNFM